MKKVLIVSPNWSNRWRDLYIKAFKMNGYQAEINHHYIHDDWTAVLFMWADRAAQKFINEYPKKGKTILFCRRYEMFTPYITNIDYNKVDHMVFCNGRFKKMFDHTFDNVVKTHLIRNGMDVNDWTFKERRNGYKLAMTCSIHPKKNIPLALYILESLVHENIISTKTNFPDTVCDPGQFSLHIAGDIQDPFLNLYIEDFAKKKNLNVKMYGKVEMQHIDEWLDDKDYLLSTSISEGNPNNVLEAMSKGIKPVIHNWIDADNQFPQELVFTDIYEAKKIIKSNYDSEYYRDYVKEEYNFNDTFRQVLELIEPCYEKCKV